MEKKRLRKSKTIKSEYMSVLADRAAAKISEGVRKQVIETMKISKLYGEECRNIGRSGYEMTRVAHNMQEYCAAIAGKDESDGKNTEICSAVDFLCGEARPFAEQIGIRLICKLPKERIFSFIDGERFAYALFNIMLNSMENSTEKGRIKITVSKSTGFVKIAVEDNGKGMGGEIFRHCAEPLFTGDSTGKKLGLGLTLAEHYIKLCGGRVRIRSEEGKGTAVSVFLPLAKEGETVSANAFEKECSGGIFIPAYITFSGLLGK